MILRYQYLSQHTKVFQAMTGLPVSLFDELEQALTEPFLEANRQRLARPNRQRAEGGGREPDLDGRDQLLMGVVWLRCYPKQAALAYLFAVSETSVSRIINRVLPLLEQSGCDTMRMPDPGRKRRRDLDELLVFLIIVSMCGNAFLLWVSLAVLSQDNLCHQGSERQCKANNDQPRSAQALDKLDFALKISYAR